MTSLVGVLFDFTGLIYYRSEKQLEEGQPVIITTAQGDYFAKILKIKIPTENQLKDQQYMSSFSSQLRVATREDIEFNKKSKSLVSEIKEFVQKKSDQLQLAMSIQNCYIDSNDEKVLITYIADTRVDFRELVKIITYSYHYKIELRQIGARDEARVKGGLGSCGLPLCCSTFLNNFDAINVNLAKNQLLTINLTKLAGQCNKLMCCLKFEDEDYAKIRPLYPEVGDEFSYLGKDYKVTNLNLLSDTITAYDGTSNEKFTLEQFNRVKSGQVKVEEKEEVKNVNEGVDLSGLGLEESKNRNEQIDKYEKQIKEKNTSSNYSNDNSNYKGNRNTQDGKDNLQSYSGKESNYSGSNRNNQSSFSSSKGGSFHSSSNSFHSSSKGGSFHSNNRNNNSGYNKNRNGKSNSGFSSSSEGFIKVSDIDDTSVLDYPLVSQHEDK